MDRAGSNSRWGRKAAGLSLAAAALGWGGQAAAQPVGERAAEPARAAARQASAPIAGPKELPLAAAIRSTAPARELPEPLASAPAGGLSVEQMISALEGERRALLALTGPGAVSEAKTPTKALKKGAKGSDVYVLCEALALRGFASDCDPSQPVVGPALDKAIREAQQSYGLLEDGIASGQLYNALRMSARERAGLIGELIEQWRSIEAQAEEMGASRYLVVNIPSFEAKAVGSGEIEMETPVIVGKPGRATPVGVMRMTALKFNPDWTPPPGILKRDVYPRMKSGGAWIDNHGLVLKDQQGNRVNWRGLSVSDLRQNGYRFVQPAGPSNALGVMKFETDSKENIYLHDTNERSLFKQAMRAKSSGCVRVKEWMDLASWAAAERSASLEKKLATEKTFFQRTDKIPVFVIYQLADFQQGKSTVYPDVYNRKKAFEASVAAVSKTGESEDEEANTNTDTLWQ